MWHHYEFGSTLIGTEARSGKPLPLSVGADRGLGYFKELYPEWLENPSDGNFAVLRLGARLPKAERCSPPYWGC
jgi:hypothetical protein